MILRYLPVIIVESIADTLSCINILILHLNLLVKSNMLGLPPSGT